MTATSPALVWFRDDLRLADNPALRHAVAAGGPVVLLFVLDDGHDGQRKIGAAARWWLSRSLRALIPSVESKGGRLILRSGPASVIVPRLAHEIGAGLVTWNRRYDAAGIAVDSAIKARLKSDGVEVQSFSAHLLREPWTVTSQAGEPMRVFTPFWRAHQSRGAPRAPLPPPQRIPALVDTIPSESLGDWELAPTKPNWAAQFEAAWTPGEEGAKETLAAFLDHGFASYPSQRDRPDKPSTSRLSPHLRFGEISPAQIWQATHLAAEVKGGTGLARFLSEIGWREFAYHLLFHRPALATENVQPRFDTFPWAQDAGRLRAWQKGLTGYPIVDAGMRQLWQTGWMHNRVRMVAASFLVKHLLIDWREGERWFWDTLVDADPANNPASWQWVAGSGADAAPYFRIFNPMRQGETFDPQGDYVRRWLPELAGLPAAAIHAPWKADAATLAGAGVSLGETYPRPIVDHDAARARALAALASTRRGDSP